MSERKHLYNCEDCGKRIHSGDKAQIDNEGIAFCEQHAAPISDLISYWQADLAGDEESAGWPEFYDDPSEVEAMIVKYQARMAAEGDIKLLQEV